MTINGISPNPETRDLTVNEVPLADNLSSDIAQLVTGAFIQRMSGGGAAVDDGSAFLSSIEGNSVISGAVAESIEMNVVQASGSEITATLDRDTFVAYVAASGTVELTYSGSAWSADPELYGITVSGEPVTGDKIVVVYVKENRGTITNATPSAFNSTGWNLFNRTVGYARVCKYSDEYGYKIGGSYTAVSFAQTIGGATSIVAVDSDGYFNVPADGFVYVTGGDATTYIFATWSDWVDDPPATFEAYDVSVIDLTEIMVFFPYGLCSVGAVRDEIDLNTKTLFRRIDRLGYSAENLETVIAYGVDYIVDTNYIYYVSVTPQSESTDVSGNYTVSDHGVEFFTNTTIPAVANVLYGENLKDKLRTNVLTISEQELSAEQQAQVQENLGIDAIVAALKSMYIVEAKTLVDNLTVEPSAFISNTYSVAKQGYTPLGVLGYIIGNATNSGGACTWITMNQMYVTTNSAIYAQYRNLNTTTAAKIKIVAYVWYVKNS